MMWTLLHRRNDGTFVIELNGYPYHVTLDDPLFSGVSAAAESIELPPEPTAPIPAPTQYGQQPTRSELMAKLQVILAQVEALEADT